MATRTTAEEILEYIRSRSVPGPGGCQIWTGIRDHGYGVVHFQGRKWRIHRLTYTLAKGEIPPKKIICHTCDVRVCWNPDHLYAGDELSNILDCVKRGRHPKAKKTHCMYGHPLEGDNVYVSQTRNGVRRRCIACDRMKRRLKAGWPEDLARNAPPLPFGKFLLDLQRQVAKEEAA